ncbi:MAG: valine--tRNA ligase, partial [Planctomycetes bacterium]|nr:valine--tRNA ligase [Planctomycetota bacterium]
EGIDRQALGRERFIERVWKWKEESGGMIINQLKTLGASCDWERERFTMDEGLSRAVREVFVSLYEEGLIYRGEYMINWCPRCHTALSDLEVTYQERDGHLWRIRYPSEDGGEGAVIATTRPETMLGDTAVCVHPSDERYKHLIGKSVTIPLVNRDIPIIADALLVDPTLGTGCVKVTPAHDPNDYACYQRNPQIGIINILNPDGAINEAGGKYQGMDRYKARDAVVADMEALGLFEGKEDRVIPMKYSDRSKTPIEPYLSDQWFVRMGDPPAACGLASAANDPDAKPQAAGLARMAMEAVENGQVKFFPERYANSYLDWLAEKRDWCISRQLWWGHRIPVWTIKRQDWTEEDIKALGLKAAKGSTDTSLEGTSENLVIQARIDPDTGDSTAFVCIAPGHPEIEAEYEKLGFTQDPDVLDTWFSSMLWPHSTLGWPEATEELKYYYPTSVLVTSRDIITLWVARMVIAGLYNLKQVPFHQVYITVKLMDGFGETMSKSKGNGVDPLDIIERYGADALRFLIMQISTETQDARMPVANVCPHCDALVPVKQEHMYMRTKKLACPNCKQPFRPGGPWPSDDPGLKTAKQASERFEIGRNFANKIWNAARFILMNLDGYTPHAVRREELPLEDRWILSRLAECAHNLTYCLENFRFSEAGREIYDFIWSEFCDWYVEMAKGRLKGDDRATVQRVLIGVLDAIVRLIHPMMPFVAESIWSALNDAAFERGLPNPEPATESVVIAPWPDFPKDWADARIDIRIWHMQELVRSVREVRNRYNIEPRTPLDAFVRCDDAIANTFEMLTPFIKQLGGVGKLEYGKATTKPEQCASYITADFEVYVSLAGLIDPAAEITRAEKQLADKRKQLAGAEAKLKNENFVKNAPPEVVEQQRALIADLQKQIATIEQNIKDLQQ